MALQDVAQAAYNTFPDTQITTPYGSYSLQVIMTAIAIAEDGGGNGPGDYGLPAGYSEYYCNGYGSFGPWQINLPYNHATVEQVSGISSSDPCSQAAWLEDYENCAQVALAIYASAGLSDWCTWGSCSGGAGAGYGPYSQYLSQAQTAIDTVQPTPGPSPGIPIYQQPALWLGIAAGLMLTGGLVLYALDIGWMKPPVLGYGFAHRMPEHPRKNHRINPKWRLFSRPTEQDVAEISAPPLNPCLIVANTKRAMEKRGVQYVEDRNLSEGIEAYTTQENGKDKIYISSAIYSQAQECKPYGAMTYLHEDTHILDHNPGCLPQFRGVTYSSEGHQVEEQEAELSSYAAMVELGQPVELYDGTVIPPGTEVIDWDLAQRYLDPDTYNNVKYATDWLVRAARGEDGDLTYSVCPAMGTAKVYPSQGKYLKQQHEQPTPAPPGAFMQRRGTTSSNIPRNAYYTSPHWEDEEIDIETTLGELYNTTVGLEYGLDAIGEQLDSNNFDSEGEKRSVERLYGDVKDINRDFQDILDESGV